MLLDPVVQFLLVAHHVLEILEADYLTKDVDGVLDLLQVGFPALDEAPVAQNQFNRTQVAGLGDALQNDFLFAELAGRLHVLDLLGDVGVLLADLLHLGQLGLEVFDVFLVEEYLELLLLLAGLLEPERKVLVGLVELVVLGLELGDLVGHFPGVELLL